MLIDMHIHTCVSSPCSVIEPESMIETAIAVGLDAVCVTEHDEMDGAEVSHRLGLEYGFPVFRGIEIYTEFGDMLVYGLNSDPPGWKTRFDELVAMCREAGAAIVPAHSCRAPGEVLRLHGREDADRMLRQVTAIETHNGGCTPEGNTAALELARWYELPGTGGSDAHHVFQIGRCFTVFEDEISTEDELVAALRAGRCRGEYRAFHA